MNLMKRAILACALISLFCCRARPESSATRAVETTAFTGRVAIFDVYDKDKRLTRQAPGVLVSARGVLMPGLKANETVVLADSQRKGETYISLNGASGSVAFIGLEAPAPQAQALVPTTLDEALPLSSQRLMRIKPASALSNWTNVIMFNDLGYVQAQAIIMNGDIVMKELTKPHPYKDGLLHTIHTLLNPYLLDTPANLSESDGEKMIRKGGAIISSNPIYDGMRKNSDGWVYKLKKSMQTTTVDILAFIGEDNEYKMTLPQGGRFNKIAEFKRKDLVAPFVDAVIESVGKKYNLPPDAEAEVWKYLGCDKHE